jgi:NADPH-dependent 2,4-dienoyl-CoA reductase/sulfur reductase-like enzyme/nitrite reductase/ring-hydroxylating ferredoxin subunit
MNYKEHIAANVNELKNGEMKTVTLDGNEVLLSKIDEHFYALGAHCTHYGALLSDGVINGDRIVCPWHHACFNAKTGDNLEPPANDSLPRYETKIDGENVIIYLPEKIEGNRVPALSVNDGSDRRKLVVIGGGAAGFSAVQSLRQEGFKGEIIFITQEDRFPYDRPNLSKDYLSGDITEQWLPLRNSEFYKEYGIETIINKKVAGINFARKTIDFENGINLKYDKILLATGAEAKKLNIPGEDLENVFTLRSFNDSNKIIEASKHSTKAIIIGASFIGLETAFSLRKRGLQVTVISQEEIPFERIFGREVGGLFKKQHEENGVNFRLSFSLKEFVGNKKVEAVLLQTGERIETDMVIIGVGVKPATSFLRNLNLLPDGSIKVNEYFEVMEDVYAAGDIATYTDWRTGEDLRIEHWRTALQQGKIVARNMLGKKEKNRSVPFFWTSQAGLTINYVGHAKDWQEIIFKGDMTSQNFIAFYTKGNKVLAAAGNNCYKELAAIEELFRLDKMPVPGELKYKSIDFVELLQK